MMATSDTGVRVPVEMMQQQSTSLATLSVAAVAALMVLSTIIVISTSRQSTKKAVALGVVFAILVAGAATFAQKVSSDLNRTEQSRKTQLLATVERAWPIDAPSIVRYGESEVRLQGNIDGAFRQCSLTPDGDQVDGMVPVKLSCTGLSNIERR